MRVILAAPRGFCAGVNMAVESLQRAIDAFGTPLYVYHEIVHNRWVVDFFRKKGAIFVNDLQEVPAGATLLYSAHGVSPSVRKEAAERGLRTIDATCPLVTKVHTEAVRFAKEGYAIVLIGHAGHDEIVGTMGEAPEAIFLVQSPDDVDRLVVSPCAKVAYLTQTTLSTQEAENVVSRLRERYPQIVGPTRDDICYATQNRQEAVRLLASEADLALIVGSANSSNSRRLAEIARSCGIDAYLIDGPNDIELNWFREEMTVAITAGASAPEQIVQLCVAELQDKFAVTVETRQICEERMRFALPEPLRSLAKDSSQAEQ